MTTAWTLPTTITQYSETGGEDVHISWDDRHNFENLKISNGSGVSTNGSLIHVARSPKHDITNKTYYIKFTGFNFSSLPDTVSGIEVRLSSRRNGRIVDETVQLCLNGELIGDNQATLDILPKKTYGGSTNFWGLGGVELSTIQDPTFGLIVRFQSHPKWPHKDPVLIDAVELRIH